MTDTELQRIIDLTKEQEKALRFDRFLNEDAFALGCFLVKRSAQLGLQMAIAIRKMNGNVVFQHCMDETTLSNENWMRRKFNTVRMTEGSSLRAWASSLLKNQDLAAQGLSAEDYVLCGGGFPIRLKTGETVAVLTVSSLPHLEDHAFAVAALSEWLGVQTEQI